MTLNKLIADYLLYLEIEKNFSSKTLENYSHWLNRLSSFIWDININELDKIKILGYRKWLKDKWLNIKTINYHITALRSFLKYLSKNDINALSADKIELSKIGWREVSYLTENEVSQIIQATKKEKIDDLTKKRDIAILETLYWSWLRVSELISLKKNNIHFESNKFQIKWKWSKIRIVFFTKKSKDSIKDYLDTRKDDSKYVFLNHSNNNTNKKPLTRVSIENIVRKYTLKANLQKKVTPHTLRHSFATSLLMKGADIRSVQTLLWHSSITTTQIYTHITDKHLEEIHNLLN